MSAIGYGRSPTTFPGLRPEDRGAWCDRRGMGSDAPIAWGGSSPSEPDRRTHGDDPRRRHQIGRSLDRKISLGARCRSGRWPRSDPRSDAQGRKLVPKLAALADANDAEFFDHLAQSDRTALLRILRGIVEKRALKSGSSGNRVGDLRAHSGGSMQERTLRRRYSWSFRP